MTIQSPHIGSHIEEDAPLSEKTDFGNGVKILEAHYDEYPIGNEVKKDITIEYASIPGIPLLRRRNAEIDVHPQTGEVLPLNGDSDDVFNGLSMDRPFIEMLQAAGMRYSIGHHIFLLSKPGVGKTEVMRMMAHLLNIPYKRVTCRKGMREEDVREQMLYHYNRDNGTWRTDPGPVPVSMMQGALLHIDEIAEIEEPGWMLEVAGSPHNPQFFERPSITLEQLTVSDNAQKTITPTAIADTLWPHARDLTGGENYYRAVAV